MRTMSCIEYLAELNCRLQAHDDYVPGMEFVFFPLGSEPQDAKGYMWLPSETVEPMQQIAAAAHGEINVTELPS